MCGAQGIDEPCVPRSVSDLPDDVVFTVEYSVRSAQIAVYSLLKLDKRPSPFYKGQYDPRVLFDALRTLHR